jgi:hypothetical protein
MSTHNLSRMFLLACVSPTWYPPLIGPPSEVLFLTILNKNLFLLYLLPCLNQCPKSPLQKLQVIFNSLLSFTLHTQCTRKTRGPDSFCPTLQATSVSCWIVWATPHSPAATLDLVTFAVELVLVSSR